MNNKGFSMVELLAAIAILAILSILALTAVSRTIEKAHEEYFNNQRNNLILAAKAYYNTNDTKLPKVIGKKAEVTAKELKNANYLKKDLTSYDGKTKCDPDNTYVRVFKYDQNKYSYTAYLNCGTHSEKYNTNEDIAPSFEDPIWKGEKEVNLAGVILKIYGGNKTNEIKLLSYSYIIYIYKDNKFVKLIDSGNKYYNHYELEKELSLSKYTISGNAKMRVKLTATNVLGNTSTKTYTRNFVDDKAPDCKYLSDKDKPNTIAGKKTWVGDKRKITINCDDGEGSGCEKQSYTKTFTSDSIVDYITIKDNAGNTKKCPVTTYIDKTKPTITATAYKCKKVNNSYVADTTKKVAEKKFTSDGTWNSTAFDDTVNGWLNKQNYPNGVCFVFTVKDNLALKSKTWKWNSTGLKKDHSNVKNLTGGPSSDLDINKDIYKTSDFVKEKEYTPSLTGEGHRYAELVITDDKGNSTTLKINVLIDRTAPTMKVEFGRCGDKDDTNCKAFTNPTAVQKVTVDNATPSATLNREDGWKDLGLQVKYNISDLNTCKLVYKWDKDYSMTSQGSASKSPNDSNTKDPATNSVIALTGTGQRQGIFIGSDAAGNSVQVTFNGKVANTCTVTYNRNGGTFGKNASNITQSQAYDSYFGSATDGLRNATGDGSYYSGSKDYYSTTNNKQWNTSSTADSGTIFDETKRYKAQNVCSGMTDGKNKTRTLYVNWHKNHVYIRYNANGGTIASSGNGYTLDGNTILHNGKSILHTLTYDGQLGSDGLLNWNNTTALNLTKSGYTIDSGAAWYQSSKYYNVTTAYKASEFCNAKNNSCTVTLYANWERACSVSNPSGCETMFVCDNGQANPFVDGNYGEVFYRSSCDLDSTTNEKGKLDFRTNVAILDTVGECYKVAIGGKAYYIKKSCLKNQSFNKDSLLGGSGPFDNNNDKYGEGRCDYICKH